MHEKFIRSVKLRICGAPFYNSISGYRPLALWG